MRVRSGLAAAVMSAAFALSAMPTAVLAAVDAFLDIDGIKGESKDDNHKDWIEVSSFSWGASNPSAGSATSGAGAGKVSMQEIHITKTVDKASPLLMQACANGKHFAKVTLQMRKAGGGDAYETYVLTDVLVSSVQANGGGSDNPTESVTLKFSKMETQTIGGSVRPPMVAPRPISRPGG